MGTLLVRNASILVTMDARRREIADGGMLIRDGWIERVDETSMLPAQADSIVDLDGCIVLPGWVNTHHHLYQSLDRACAESQDAALVGWLAGLYPRWTKRGPEDLGLAAEIGLVELVLSGCTTMADHQYIWPEGADATQIFEVARRIGVRFHLGRGAQNIGADNGGFAPSSLVERDERILSETARAISEHHDPLPGSFRQVFVAPSSLRSVTPELMRAMAELACVHNVRFHMHLGETRAEAEFFLERLGQRPTRVARELGCLTPRSWIAHGVHLDADDIEILHESGCGVCHCPSSNMRLASGIAPVQAYRRRGVNVGLGVDGAASNDSSNMLTEMRMALLLARVGSPASEPLLDARAVLEMATLGGAALLGRTDLGSLQSGFAADFIAVSRDRIELLGADDPVAALALCALTRVDHAWVHGRQVVRNQTLIGHDHSALVERCRSRALRVA